MNYKVSVATYLYRPFSPKTTGSWGSLVLYSYSYSLSAPSMCHSSLHINSALHYILWLGLYKYALLYIDMRPLSADKGVGSNLYKHMAAHV